MGELILWMKAILALGLVLGCGVLVDRILRASTSWMALALFHPLWYRVLGAVCILAGLLFGMLVVHAIGLY